MASEERIALEADPDDPEDFDVGEDGLAAALEERRARLARGPQRNPVKTPVSIRLDREVVDHYRATGTGWQSRINADLRKAAGL